MSLWLTVLAALTLAGWLALALDAARGHRNVVFLADQPAAEGDGHPKVSIIVAARNEERNIEEALRSLLALQYDRLEVIVVDDRSEDNTGAILDAIATQGPRLRVEHLRTLPDGWLGKNHALQHGAARATGELLLFTDADVVFDPSLLGRAVTVMEEERLDHLTAAGDVVTPGLATELFVATFALLFNAYFRPWRMGQPGRREAIGVGAFNLVRGEVYASVGGHAAIAMRPDDDLQLARLLQRHGARQRFATAGTMLRVEWYPSLPAAVRGLEKNSLAVVDYSFALLLAGVVAELAAAVWPFIALFVTSGVTWSLNVGIVLLLFALQAGFLRSTSLRMWTALALPLGTCLIVFTTLRAATLTWWRGGIVWRGTFYRTEDLRRPADPGLERDVGSG